MTARTPEKTAPGTIIAGKYRVECVLGEGGMGVVFEATHLVLGQRVAMKLLRAEIAHATDTNARFLREARIAAQLPPEHIARVTDIGETEAGEPYLVMELLKGRDLAAELAARGPLPVQEAVDYILQACEGLAEAHAVGLVHRDIKPANIFLASRRGEPPAVKILDFGLSKSFDVQGVQALTQTSTNFGTPAYMSPEQIRSAKYVEPRSDQHALAMILYEILTGKLPYDAESLTGLAVVIATAPPPSARAARRDVPPGLDAAIKRGLGKQPADRFPSLVEFAAAIAPFGGAQAAAAAARVSQVLEPKLPDARTIPNPPRPPLPSDHTAKARLSTHSPTMSDPHVVRGIRRGPILVAIAGVIVAGTLFFLLLRSGPPPEPPPATQPTAEVPPVTPPTAEPSAAPAPPPPETPTASSTATTAPSATAAPSGSVNTKRPGRPGTPTRPTAGTATTRPSDQQKTPRDVFGGGK